MTASESGIDLQAAPTVVVGSTPGPASETELASVGSRVGRYVVIDSVGRGGMGEVLRAYDPKLQREVALKLLRGGGLGGEARDRLLREARAMAQLSHPHVVNVFDVEDAGPGLVLVMEYVAGTTLRVWLDARRRPASEVLAYFAQAGQGLAAAHGVGLLHRDFKPTNVLVSHDGVVKVTDFGLAKPVTATGAGHAVDSDPEVANDVLDRTLTRAGSVIGTPRYMAPEQHSGGALSAAADQYGFCVALWEALCGGEPFTGATPELLLAAKRRGQPTEHASHTAGSPAVMSALRRGLSPDPADRWPSMPALLLALADGPRGRRRALVGVATVAVVAAASWSWWSSRSQQPPCSGASEQLARVWGPSRRDDVERGMMALGLAYAQPVVARTIAALDDYGAQWTTMRTQTCEATTIRKEQSTAVMDLRMACLHRVEIELGSVVDVLVRADATTVRRAHELVGALPSLARCADVTALTAEIEPPSPNEVAAVDEIRNGLAAANAEFHAGHYHDAKSRIDALVVALEGLEYGPVRAEVALLQGRTLERLSDFEGAEQALLRALESAARGRQTEQMHGAATQLMFVVGHRMRRIDEALRYRELAQGLSSGDPRREMGTANDLGVVFAAQGRAAEAEQQFRTSVALRQQVLGVDDPRVAAARNNLGNALKMQGKYGEAEAEQRAALELRERVLGGEHPDVAESRINLASVLIEQGKPIDGEAEARRALATYAVALDDDNVDAGLARNQLATALTRQGKHAEAEAEYRLTLATWSRALPVGHPYLAGARNNIANALYLQGRVAEAADEYRAALVAMEHSAGPDHPDTATALENVAALLLEIGQNAEALAAAERAWKNRARPDTAPATQARCAFVLARALWLGSAAERPRALEMAARAEEALAAEPGLHAEALVEIRGWRAQHRLP